MSAELVVADGLEGLADRANDEHRQVGELLLEAGNHAVAAGLVLLEARSKFPPRGGWMAWFNQNCDIPYQTACIYMRIARYRDQLPDGPVSLQKAKELTAFLPNVNLVAMREQAQVRAQDARQMAEDGMAEDEIAERLNVCVATVRTYLDPAAMQAKKEYNERRRRQQAQARVALRQKQERERRDLLAKGDGGSLGDCYTQIRRTASKLDRALSGTTGAQHDAVRDALTALHAAEDQIVRALRMDRA